MACCAGSEEARLWLLLWEAGTWVQPFSAPTHLSFLLPLLLGMYVNVCSTGIAFTVQFILLGGIGFCSQMSWSFWLNGISTISRPVVVICRQIGKTVSCICVSLMLWKDMSTWHEISYLHNTNMIQCVGTSVLTIPYQSTIYHHTHGDLVGFSGFYHERSFITWTFSY